MKKRKYQPKYQSGNFANVCYKTSRFLFFCDTKEYMDILDRTNVRSDASFVLIGIIPTICVPSRGFYGGSVAVMMFGMLSVRVSSPLHPVSSTVVSWCWYWYCVVLPHTSPYIEVCHYSDEELLWWEYIKWNTQFFVAPTFLSLLHDKNLQCHKRRQSRRYDNSIFWVPSRFHQYTSGTRSGRTPVPWSSDVWFMTAYVSHDFPNASGHSGMRNESVQITSLNLHESIHQSTKSDYFDPGSSR